MSEGRNEAIAKMGAAFREAGEHFKDKMVAAMRVPPPLIGEPKEQHTKSCQELIRAGIVRRCTCPKGY